MYKMKNNKTDNIEEHFVDLGLPSGIKWAKTNLGAASETDYGNYYIWGSTEPNTADECNWANTPFNGGSDSYEECNWANTPFDNGSDSYNKKYFNAYKSEWLDDKNNLKPEYDAAYKATDGAARMPTQDDIQELIDNTIKQWVDNYNGTGVSGRKFISKTDETKYIFIPAAGNYDDGSVDGVGIYGLVWSSSLYTLSTHNAWNLYLFMGDCRMYDGYRYFGRSIRPVTD